MRTVLFSIRQTVPIERFSDVIASVNRLEGVHRVAMLNSQSKSDAVRRMGFVEVADDADVSDVLKRLSSVSELEHVELPAQRGLA